MAKPQTQPHHTVAPPASPQEEEPQELSTELALGSDGLLYVNAEHLSAEQRKGRRMFQGYAMTPEEGKRAVDTMHRIAFELTVTAMPKASTASRRRRSTK